MKKFLSIFFLLIAIGSFLYFLTSFRPDFLGWIERLSTNFISHQKPFFQDFESFSKDFSVQQTISSKVILSSPLRVFGQENQTKLTKEKIIEETNKERIQKGLSPLKEDKRLSLAAQAKAEDMFANQYFDHQSPLGIDPSKLVKSYGYEYLVLGENLILGNFSSEKEIVEKWMESHPHRENILNKHFTEIGVAIVKGVFKNETVWIGVQEFAVPLSICPQPKQELENQIVSHQEKLKNLLEQIKEKEEQTNNAESYYNKKRLIKEYNDLVEAYNLLVAETKLLINEYNNQVNIFNSCLEKYNY